MSAKKRSKPETLDALRGRVFGKLQTRIQKTAHALERVQTHGQGMRERAERAVLEHLDTLVGEDDE